MISQNDFMILMIFTICILVIIFLVILDRWFQKESQRIAAMQVLNQEMDKRYTPKKAHKKYDVTPFTQAHYDFIVARYPNFKSNKVSQQRMADFFNSELNLDKSITSYRTIWSGKVSRDSLPAGK